MGRSREKVLREGYLTLAQWARRHGSTRQRASYLYRAGRIEGAVRVREGGVVQVPADTPWPSRATESDRKAREGAVRAAEWKRRQRDRRRRTGR